MSTQLPEQLPDPAPQPAPDATSKKRRRKREKHHRGDRKTWVPAIVSAGAGLGVIGLSLWLWSVLQEYI